MAKNDQFIKQIENGMGMFGLDLKTVTPGNNELQHIMFADRVHGTGYAVIAQHTAPDDVNGFWREAISKDFVALLKKTKTRGSILPAALIVPEVTVNAIVAYTDTMGVRPTSFKLFGNYVVLGFKSIDATILVQGGVKEDRKEDLADMSDFVDEDIIVASDTTPSQYNKNFTPEITAKSTKSSTSKFTIVSFIALIALAGGYALNKYQNVPLSVSDAYIEIITALSGKPPSDDLQAALAVHAKLLPEQLERLVNSGHAYNVAQNPNLPERWLDDMVNSRDMRIKSGAARNVMLNVEQLTKLVSDPNPQVRAAAASNPSLTPALMEQLSTDNDFAVRSGLLDTPSLTREILDVIEPDLANATCENRQKIYAGKFVTRDELEYNASNTDVCIRRGVAANTNTPRSLLEILAQDNDMNARHNALKNRSLLPENLELFGDNWQLTTNPVVMADINAALTNQSLSRRMIEIAALDPANHGAFLAANDRISQQMQRELYVYSIPKDGMVGFFNDLEEMVTSKTLIIKLNVIRDSYPIGKRSGVVAEQEWHYALRDAINQSFKKNVYDPIELSQALTGYVKTYTVSPDFSGNVSWPVLPAPGAEVDFAENAAGVDVDKTAGTFADMVESAQMGPEIGKNRKMNNLRMEMIRTADAIVDLVMQEMIPAMEYAMDRQFNPALANETYPPNGSVVVLPNDNSFVTASYNGTPSNVLEIMGRPALFKSVLSQNLYNKSSERIVNLQKLVQKKRFTIQFMR